MNNSLLPSNFSICFSDHFRIRLAQLTNKCTDDDVEYYVRECGDILGVSSQINNPDDPKEVLHFIFNELIKFKSPNEG